MLLAALLSVLPMQQSSDVAVGVFPFLVGNMDPQVQQVVDEVVANEADTLYVSVFRATGPQTGDLWITDSAGVWNAAWGSVRPTGAGIDLPRLIQAAHQKNLRVVGVLKCFDATVQPTSAAHRSYLLDVVDYLVGSYQQNGMPVYDLDGLALDYVRFVSAGTGNDPRFVTDFVRDVRARIGVLTLHAYLMANRYTFDGPTYNGQFRSYAEAMAILAGDFGQHWEQLSRYLDVLMPMCYTADGSIYSTYALHQAYVRQAAAYSRTACNRGGFPGRRVQPVVKTYTGGGEVTTPQTIDASITGALAGGADGYQAFRWGTLRGQASWWAVMKQYAVPGANFPVPDLVTGVVGLGGTFDGTKSRDGDEPSSALKVRFDWENDGTFDTGWLANAPVDQVLHGPGAWRIGMQVRDSDGHFSATTRRVSAGNVLGLGRPAFFATLGGSVPINLDTGPQTKGATYLVLGSFAGLTPGTPWRPGFHLPLNLDSLTEALLGAVNTPVLMNALGQLDAQGRATAQFSAPPGLLAPLAYKNVYWAAIAAGPSGPLFVTNGAAMLILP